MRAVAILLAAALGVSAAFDNRGSLFEAGKRFEGAQQYREAAAAYRAFLKQNPTSAPALTNLGVVLARQGLYEEAAAQYRLALQVEPHASPAQLNLAILYYRQSDWPNAASWLETYSETRARETGQEDRRAIQLLAICETQRKRFEAAARLYEQLMPSDEPSILIGLASAFRETGRKQESDRLLALVFEKHGDSPEANYLMGLAHFARQDYAKAAKSFRTMSSLAPDRADAFFYLGASYLKLNDAPGAMTQWKKALAGDESYYPARFALGAVEEGLGMYAEAEADLQKAVAGRPRDAAAKLELGKVLMKTNRSSDALPLLEEAAHALPDSQQANYLLATVYARLGRTADAAERRRRTRFLVEENHAESILADAIRADHEVSR